MRSFLTCSLTAVLACLGTFWLMETRRSSEARAQSPAIGTDHGKRESSAPSIRKIPSHFFDERGLTPDEAINVDVYDLCNRSVVNISTVSVRADGLFRIAVPEQGAGSGAVISHQGHILTNHHVIDGAGQIEVTLYNGESYHAKRVGSDPVNDIAIIQVEAPEEDLFPVELGDSDTAKVGMRVFALGNPFGLERTMSVGIISSLNRTLEIQENWVIKSIIQIDASINPGNSGGPLIDSHGRLIGVNTAIASRVAQSAGIGFAIPINLIKRIVPELIKHGRVVRGDIGITAVQLVEEGLRIRLLEPDGAAKDAGIRGPKITRRGPFQIMNLAAADVITAVDGDKVATPAEFLERIETSKPGDRITLTVLRDGKSLDIEITLGGETMPETLTEPE